MHYIRLLRSPQLVRVPGALHLELLVTITTDLGDSFLQTADTLTLQVTAFVKTPTGTAGYVLGAKDATLQWRPSARVAKPVLDIPKPVLQALVAKQHVEICVAPSDSSFIASSIGNILEAPAHGQIMPAWTTLAVKPTGPSALRRRIIITDSKNNYIEVEEEIGESIARHIWDAGVLSLCSIVSSFAVPSLSAAGDPCMKAVCKILQAGANILELGCGVGILGIGIAQIMRQSHMKHSSTLLMTDLDEAQERAESNIHMLSQRNSGKTNVCVEYENLDWEKGRIGDFTDKVRASAWDLIILSDCTYNADMLPALVETLSAIHESNKIVKGSAKTQVFMATKPRHDSERAFFSLLDKEHWKTVHKQIIPLPVIEAEAQTIEMYLFEKI